MKVSAFISLVKVKNSQNCFQNMFQRKRFEAIC